MGVNVTFDPQDLTTSNLRLFQIAVPLNRYDEVVANIFKFMQRTGVGDLLSLDLIQSGIGSGNLEEIIKVIGRRITLGGVVVVNCVLKRTADLAPKLLLDSGFEVEIPFS